VTFWFSIKVMGWYCSYYSWE